MLALHPQMTTPVTVSVHHQVQSSQPGSTSVPTRSFPTPRSTTTGSTSRTVSALSNHTSPPTKRRHPPSAIAVSAPSVSSTLQSQTDIASYPSNDLLKLLAQLLQRIATSNDKVLHANNPPATTGHARSYSFDDPAPSQTSPALSLPPPDKTKYPLYTSLTTASRSSVASPTSPLFFHARNVPTISVESYLLRILKYCPTTNEVFLSLLVYFDRMAALGKGVQREWASDTKESTEKDLVEGDPALVTPSPLVIDSYNIHRLIIAGVTVASKFFSDVFYTNSRYAKVGGLPTQELNKLELQFLLLNDFRLAIPPDELSRYFERLLLTAPPTTPSSLTTSPSIELFGTDYSPRQHPSFSLSPSPPPLYTPPADASFAPSLIRETSSSTDSSVAPTPSSTASGGGDVLSSSSASTITQISYANASEVATPVAPNQPEDQPEDDDPTIRVGTTVPGIVHSQYSSYANTDLSSDSEPEGRRTRDESPAASLRYVDGQWGRGQGTGKTLKRMPSDDSEGHLTEDEVVYRGTSSSLTRTPASGGIHSRGRSAA